MNKYVCLAALAAVLLFTFQLSAQTYPTCGGPNGISYAFHQNSVWVACYLSGQIQQLSAANGAVLRTLSVPTGAPFAFLFAGENYLWVTAPLSNEILEIEISTGVVIETIQVGGTPLGITNGGCYGNLHVCMWTANSGGSVSAFNLDTGVVTTYDVPNCAPGGILWTNNSEIWVTCGNDSRNLTTVAQLNNSGGYLGAINLPGTAYSITEFLNQGTMYALVGTGTPQPGISEINESTGQVTSYSFGYTPFSGVVFDGTYIWACGADPVPDFPQSVQKLTISGESLGLFPVGGYGRLQSCAYGTNDGGGLWVSNYNQDSVTFIPE